MRESILAQFVIVLTARVMIPNLMML